MEEKNISSEQESLDIITQMIAKAKGGFHETGTSAILWGSVVAVCGLATFAQFQFGFTLPFDVWLLTLAAIVPQVFISIRQSRRRVVLSHVEVATNAIWIVYAVSIFALVFYFNVTPRVADRLLAGDGLQLFQKTIGGETRPWHSFVPSQGSLLLLLYAVPTLATGIIHRFRPMLVGAILCYGFFIASCFTASSYDMLMNGLAGIFNWLIPGLILRRKYQLQKKAANV